MNIYDLEVRVCCSQPTTFELCQPSARNSVGDFAPSMLNLSTKGRMAVKCHLVVHAARRLRKGGWIGLRPRLLAAIDTDDGGTVWKCIRKREKCKEDQTEGVNYFRFKLSHYSSIHLTQSQFPFKSSFQRLTLLSPPLTANTFPLKLQLTRHTTASNSGRTVHFQSPSVLGSWVHILTVLSCDALAMYDLESTVGAHATSRTQSVWPVRVFVVSYPCVWGLYAQIFKTQSLPPVTNRRCGPSPPASLRTKLPGATAGAQLTAFTPIPCAWKMFVDQFPSRNSRTETWPSDEAQASKHPSSCGDQEMRFTEAVCCVNVEMSCH